MTGKTLEIFKALFAPFSEMFKKELPGGKGTYVEWHQYVVRAHETFPNGYSKTVTAQQVDGTNKDGEVVSTLVVTVRITCMETGAHQEALGSADAGKTSWGGAVAEAESQAMRRAFANWGLGLEMYMDDDQYESVVGDTKEPTTEPAEGADDETVEADASDRMIEVLTVLGSLLATLADEEEDEDLEDFVSSQRARLAKGLTHKRAGVVISKFRAKLEELELEDPTKRDED